MPAYLGLLRVEIARFTRLCLSTHATRLWCSNPHLTVDGRYPLPCSMESGLSSAHPTPANVQRPSGELPY
jgi:hypothetical protein